MTCREVDEALIASARDDLAPQVREHLASCDSCRKLASVMASASRPQAFPAGVRDRVRSSIPATIAPIRPLAPAALWIILFLLLFAGIGIGAAARSGIYGWLVLSMAARILIFSVLLAVSVWAAFATAHQMRPGSGGTRSGTLLLLALLSMEIVFFLVFDDYSLGQFFRAGLRCLGLGMLVAVPAGLGVCLLVRRGYILAPISAGCSIGALAGLTGLFALELHCPILTIPHVAIWHAAVVAVSAALGAAGGWIGSRTRSEE
jgi:Negative regulator of sigma F